jgi:hypothetical protein
MTVADVQTDPVREFRQQLPAHARNSLNVTQLVVALVHAAVRDHGWTPKQLASECGRDLGDVVNAGAVVTDRLRKAAQHPPANQPTAAAKRPLCTDCEDGWITDPDTHLPTARCPCRTAT